MNAPAVPTDAELEALAARLGAALLRKSMTVSTAESCTGGWVAKTITDVPGSSQWFDRGYVTYSDAAKQALLGVTAAQLDAHGAVSEAVAAAMAAGARAAAQADCAVAVSGIAGPAGGMPDKPVGTVCFAWAGPTGVVTAREHFAGDRDAVRRRSVACALARLLAHIDDPRQAAAGSQTQGARI